MLYLVKTPWLVRKMYPDCLWKMPSGQKAIYLTFDDGPHPVATPLALDELRRFGAKATFFCIGKNVVAHPDIYKRILDEGHRVGNHTHNHLNGWKSDSKEYNSNIQKAAGYIDSDLFRPPYGKINRYQIEFLKSNFKFRIVMWDVLSGDFDRMISGMQCAVNVTSHAEDGSIVIFHDSEKAFERMRVALPVVLKYFQEKGFRFESLQ
jgi:peptidoglycan/xylan/chitin deacetylase (PgdA/CDA1 family)